MTTEDQAKEPLAINPDLIREYAAGAEEWGIQQLITLFDFQRRQMQRAEDLCRAAWAHAIELQKQLSRTTVSERPPRQDAPERRPERRPEAPKPRKPSAEALEIDL